MTEINKDEIKTLYETSVNSDQLSNFNSLSKDDRVRVLMSSFTGISPADGVQILPIIFMLKLLPQISISPIPLESYLEELALPQVINKIKEHTASHTRPDISIPYVEPSNEIEKAISEIWQSVLGIDKIGINDTLSELGGNSLIAVQIIANIVDLFELDITVDLFNEDTTVSTLSKLVIDLLSKADK